MKLKSIVFLSLLPILSARASYLESCRVWADIRTYTDATHLVINVRRVSMQDGSHGKSHCNALRAGSQVITLTEGRVAQTSKEVELEYWYSDGMGPNGLVFTKRWKLIKEN